MQTTLQFMTLQEILRQHGILAPSELRRRVLKEDGTPVWTRAQAYNLWSGRAGVGKATMRLLHDKLGIPYEELMEVDDVPSRRKRPSEEEESQA
jgi:hypothetical protein